MIQNPVQNLREQVVDPRKLAKKAQNEGLVLDRIEKANQGAHIQPHPCVSNQPWQSDSFQEGSEPFGAWTVNVEVRDDGFYFGVADET